MIRWVRHVVFAALSLTACGGTVKEDSGTPTEQLQASGGSRCKAACETVLACGLGSKTSCSCGCACPDAGATDCKCGPCNCPASTEETPARCESDCNEAVQKAAASSKCAPAMLKLLDCFSSASCSNGQVPCKAESDAMKTCMESVPASGNAESPTVANPGPIGSDNSTVTCHSASGGGSAAPSGSKPAPGTTFCTTGWDSCSDGKSYSVECDIGPALDLSCLCLVDGAPQASFGAADCPQSSTDADRLCGWSLQ